MNRLTPLIALVLAACGGEAAPIPAVDLQIRIEVEARSIHPGQGFGLAVVRTWRKGLDPSPWDDELLSPLRVKAEGAWRREDERRVEETRRFRAYAMALDDVTVPAVPFAARPLEGGELRIAAARPLALRVVPVLDAAAPGPPELPGELPARSFPWILLLAGLAVAVGVAVAVRRKPTASAVLPTMPAPAPAAEALRALAAVRDGRSGDRAADVAAIAGILRAYLGARFGIDGRTKTTPELARVADVRPVLGACDRVKFGAHVPSPEGRAALLEDAEALVRRTAP